MSNQGKKSKHLGLHVAYSLVVVLICVPIAALIYLSLARQWAFPALLGGEFSLENWGLALGGTQGLAGSFLLSTAIAVSIGMACTLGGFVVSRYLNYHPRGRFLISLAYYPYLIAPVVLGVMLRFYFIKMGISGTVYGVWLAQFLFIFPYSILFFGGFWTPRTQAMEAQALTLGANPWQVFMRVLLPAGREWLYICFFQTLMFSWFEYGVTQYAGIGKVPTLTVRTMQFVKEANPHFAAVAACLMVLPLLAFALLNQRLLYRNPQAHD
jgi:putative spermidine/putrescine transport system permease protein